MFLGRAVELTRHIHNRLKERGIKYADIRKAIESGEIIKQLVDDYPNPSILILGQARDGKPLHVAVGVDDNLLWLITAYEPTLDFWEIDYKTRKEID
jgi:hypothetical protein